MLIRERFPVGPCLNVATDPKVPGPSLIRSFFLLFFTPVVRGVPELEVQICLTLSSRKARYKFFYSDWLASVQVFHKTQSSC